MRKLLIILIISIVSSRYDYDLLKNAFNCLKEKGFLDKIKTAIFTYGEIVAIEKCAIYLQQCPVVKPSEEPSEEPSEVPSEEPSDDPSDKPTDKPTDKPKEDPTDKPLKTDSGDIILPEVRRLFDVDLPTMSFDVNTNKTDEHMTDDIPEKSDETDEPDYPDEEQMTINRAICLRIFGYF